MVSVEWSAAEFRRLIVRRLASRLEGGCHSCRLGVPSRCRARGSSEGGNPLNSAEVGRNCTLIYFASKRDCETCALKQTCCPNAPARKIARSVHEAARDKARAIAKTEAYAVSRRQRKKVEMLFAHLKRILRLDRLRLRGPSGAKDEFLLAATAQNLRKLAKLIPVPTPGFAI